MIWFAIIIILTIMAALTAAWRLPGLNLYATDRLMRARGILPEPDNIVIVAIDDASIAKLGRFPWRRGLMARGLDKIARAEAKAIAVDVLYPELTDVIEDKALADAIKRAGNVAVATQLVENRNTPELSRSEWLDSLPEIERASSGIGHVNVETESDGAARELLLRLADDAGKSKWALAVETIRIGDNLNPEEVDETANFVRIGTRKIPIEATAATLSIRNTKPGGGLNAVRPLRMPIDYIGPTGSFMAQTVSFSDLLEDKISPERFRGRYVLIGATAATLGDRIASPFVHTEDSGGDQHGDLMPGVEILANSIDTIVRQRFYTDLSDWMAAFFAAVVGAIVLFLINQAEGKFGPVKQIAFLALLVVVILLVSYLVFAKAFIIPPVVPMLAAFMVATPLGLLRRSVAASVELDQQIDDLAAAEKNLFPHVGTDPSSGRKGFTPRFPRGLERKAQALGDLSRDLIARSLFVDLALQSSKEALLIADTAGTIIFANHSGQEILGSAGHDLLGSDLFETIAAVGRSAEGSAPLSANELRTLREQNRPIEAELGVGQDFRRYYILRIAPVNASSNGDRLGFIGTLSDVTHHRELQQTQNDVIGLVTHELRTPLTAIQGMSELLIEHDIDPAPRKKMLGTINDESKRLTRMVNEYLDIARLESGVQKASFASAELDPVVEQALVLLEPIALVRGITIVRRYQDDPISVRIDSELMGRAVTNIVANAIKYSPENTSVTVETRNSPDGVQIMVRDEGVGIHADHLPRIFDKFFRGAHRRTTEFEGTGLGLALTKEIVELHGGRITAESSLNEGSVFTITLLTSPK